MDISIYNKGVWMYGDKMRVSQKAFRHVDCGDYLGGSERESVANSPELLYAPLKVGVTI